MKSFDLIPELFYTTRMENVGLRAGVEGLQASPAIIKIIVMILAAAVEEAV